MHLTLPYPPSTNRSWRFSKGRVFQTPATLAWKKHAGWIARMSCASPSDTPMAVQIILHPKLTAKGHPSKRRLDIDNVCKPTLDALNGIAWLDDSQIVSLEVSIGNPMPAGGLTVNAQATT